jgi:hypothetical protein
MAEKRSGEEKERDWLHVSPEETGGGERTPSGGVVPSVVPSRLPVSPAYKAMEQAVREDSRVHAPPPERPREPAPPLPEKADDERQA